MELRAFIAIFLEHGKLLWSIVVVFLVIGMLFFVTQPERYSTSLTLNVARAGVPASTEENFSGFYRFQADERFGDTIVRWLESPRIVQDVLTAADENITLSEDELRATFSAARLSSQVVEVRFLTTNQQQAKARSTQIVNVLNGLTENLNVDQDDSQWFVIIGEEPVIRPHAQTFGFALALALVAGLFTGLLSVLFWHYYRR